MDFRDKFSQNEKNLISIAFTIMLFFIFCKITFMAAFNYHMRESGQSLSNFTFDYCFDFNINWFFWILYPALCLFFYLYMNKKIASENKEELQEMNKKD